MKHQCAVRMILFSAKKGKLFTKGVCSYGTRPE